LYKSILPSILFYMEQIKNNSEAENTQFEHLQGFLNVLPGNIRRIDSNTIRTEKPLRCRALLFSDDGQNIALIGRERNGISYTVLPGGGVEDEDSDAISAVQRELQEELSVEKSDIAVYDEEALETEPGVWVFLAKAKHPDIVLMLGEGPEQERNGKTERGLYLPGWLPLKNFSSVNLMPYEFRNAVAEAARVMQHDEVSQNVSE